MSVLCNSTLCKSTADEVEETVETVIDDIISGLGALSPLGGLITSLLSLCGLSSGTVTGVLSFVTALSQFLVSWEDRLVTLIMSGYSAYEDLVAFCKGLWQLFGGDDSDTEESAAASLARIYAGATRIGKMHRTAANACVSDMQAYAAEICSWLRENPDAACIDQRAAMNAITAKWKQVQAVRLSAATADAIAAA